MNFSSRPKGRWRHLERGWSSPVVSGDLTLPDLDLQPKPKQQALTNRRISLSSCRPAPLSGSINSLLINFPHKHLPFLPLHTPAFSTSISLSSSKSPYLLLTPRLPRLAASSTPYCRPVPRLRLDSAARRPLPRLLSSCEMTLSPISRCDRDSTHPAEPFFQSVPLVMFSTPHRRNNESVDAQPAIFKLDGHAVRRSIRLGKSIFIT